MTGWLFVRSIVGADPDTLAPTFHGGEMWRHLDCRTSAVMDGRYRDEEIASHEERSCKASRR